MPGEGAAGHPPRGHLGIHHGTVERALALEGIKSPPPKRRSIIEPFVPWIRETLERYSRLPASTLYGMARRRGYPGRERHFRHCVAEAREEMHG